MDVVIKYSRFVVWIGPSLVAMGVSAGAISGSWGVVPVALIGVGTFLTIFYLVLAVIASPDFWRRRSTQASADAIVATLSVLLILGIINFLGARYAARLDLTDNQLFTLSPQTQQVVKALKQPVKIWVFLKPGDPEATATRSLLEQYRQLNASKFSFEIVDPQAKPLLAKQFGVTSFGEVYLEAGDQRQQVQQVTPYERLAEGRLTNRLELLSGGKQTVVYFTQGHQELPLERQAESISQVSTLLLDKSIKAEPLNLSTTATVPTNAAAVVVAGPRRPFLEGEIKALTDYSDRGGSLLLLLDPTVKTGLESFLETKWGVKLDDRLVINASQQQLLGPSTPVISQYGQHPITEAFRNGFSAYPFARPIALVPTKDVQQFPLLITDNQNWAETNLDDTNLKFEPDKGDIRGPLTIGAALTRSVTPKTAEAATTSPSPTPESSPSPTASPSPSPSPSPTTSPSPSPSPATEQVEARLVIIGNSQFASNQLVQNPGLLNSDVILNAVTWLTRQDDRALAIRPKESKNRALNLTSLQANLIGWIALIILPLVGFSTAAALWWRRR
ncbi:MAG: Gldg family protein [Cyanobacteriota bacterium SKYGB_h_bin112]|nr:Gldg family protein [Cyanobacteriota bacterium SKYGB_h_bin112]